MRKKQNRKCSDQCCDVFSGVFFEKTRKWSHAAQIMALPLKVYFRSLFRPFLHLFFPSVPAPFGPKTGSEIFVQKVTKKLKNLKIEKLGSKKPFLSLKNDFF